MASEKIVEVYFSSVGNVLATMEQEGMGHRHSVNFYMISRISNEGQINKAEHQSTKKGAKTVTADKNRMTAVDDTFEFRKLARYEVADKHWVAKWEDNGRYFLVYGRKSSAFDKTTKCVRFYNMFGELIMYHNDLTSLDHVHFRPRPNDILKPDTVKKLKKNYKKIYEATFKQDEEQ